MLPNWIARYHPSRPQISKGESDLIDWPIAALFVLGGIAGGVAGVSLSNAMAARKQALDRAFAILVIARRSLHRIARGRRAYRLRSTENG